MARPPVVILEHPRFTLRRIVPDDAEAMFALNNDPEVVRYTGDGPFPDKEAARDFVIGYQGVYEREDGMARWAFVVDGAVVGFCGLRRVGDDVDLGYRLVRRLWGRGLATDAARATLAYGFAHPRWNLTRIIGRAHEDNAASIRVLEKAGMRFVGAVDLDGDPSVLYEIVRPE